MEIVLSREFCHDCDWQKSWKKLQIFVIYFMQNQQVYTN